MSTASVLPETSIHPETLEQVENGIREWFRGLTEPSDPPITFSRTPRPTSRLCVRAQAFADLVLETRDQIVFFQAKNHRLALYAEDFVVTTLYEDQMLCINFERNRAPESRSLVSALKQVADAKHPVFLSRALRAVKSLEEQLPNAMIEDAAAARTDFEVLVDALLSGIPDTVSADPLTVAKLRGLKRKQKMLERAGGTMTSEEVAELLGITRQAVDKRRSSSLLIALSTGKRGYAYPRFQFDEDGRVLVGLDETLRQLQSVDPWMQLVFFTTENERLGGQTPIQALQNGRSDAVVDSARGFGGQGPA